MNQSLTDSLKLNNAAMYGHEPLVYWTGSCLRPNQQAINRERVVGQVCANPVFIHIFNQKLRSNTVLPLNFLSFPGVTRQCHQLALMLLMLCFGTRIWRRKTKTIAMFGDIFSNKYMRNTAKLYGDALV